VEVTTDNISSIALMLRATVGNPLSRFFIKRLVTKKRLEKILEKYANPKIKLGSVCSLYYPLVKAIINSGARAFGVPEEKMKNFFQERIHRRGLCSVLKGIAHYGITKPQNLLAPFLVVWDITYACNLKCKHCYSNAGKKLKNELSDEEVKRIIDELDEIGVVAIAFSGGEPLVRKNFFEIARYASSKGFYVAVATNGTMITEEVARKMKESGIRYVEVSLDGASPETHDSFRGIEGAFEKAVEGIKNAKEQGMMTAIATTITTHNYYEVEDLIELALKLGVDRFIHFNFIPTGRGEKIVNEDLTPEERERLLRFLYKKSKELKGRLQVFSTAPQYARIALQEALKRGEGEISFTFYGGNVKNRMIGIAEFISGCGAGRMYCGITPDGKVKPCVFMPIIVGDLREKSFSEIWNNSEILKSLRDRSDLKGHCGTCRYKYVCGGCRSRAYAYSGDIKGYDPGCIYNEKILKEAEVYGIH